METIEEIFLDHHTSTKMCKNSSEVFQKVTEEHWSSVYSPHFMGQKAVQKANEEITHLQEAFGADGQFYPTSSGAQANLQVILSNFFHFMYETGKNHIITPTTEMASLFLPMQQLQKENCRVDLVDVKKDGTIDLKELKQKLGAKTALFSMSWASGLTGVLQPIEEIEKICQEKNVLLHVDATYVLGKVEMQLNQHQIPFLTFDGETLHSGKSFGGIFVKEDVTFEPFPMFFSDVASLSAFREGYRQAMLFQDRMNLEIARCRDQFEQRILEVIPEAKVLFSQSLRLPNTSVICFSHVHQESLLYYLNERKVYATFGGNKEQHLSNVLIQMGYPPEIAHCALSFSFSRYTTEEEITEAIQRIQKGYETLRSYSQEIF